MAKKYYANLFVTDSTTDPAETLVAGKFGGVTLEINQAAILNEAGTALNPSGVTVASVIPVIAAIATANATTEATGWALANANKVKINALIAAMTTAGIMASS